MIPRCGGLRIGYRRAPFFPRQKGKPWAVPKVRRNSLGVPAQCHRRGGTDMEALADCAVRVCDRKLERLRQIISVNVMDRFHSQIRQDQLLAIRDLREHFRVEMSGRVKWTPAGTHDVPGMENRRSNHSLARWIEQPFFDRRLFYPVIAKRLARLRLCGRHDGAVSMHPDGSAMEEQHIAVLERLNQMLRTLRREANQIYDDFRPERCNAVSECAGGFFFGAVDSHSLYVSPRAVGLIGFACSAAHGDYFVSGGDKPRDQEGADMAGGADDDDSNGRIAWAVTVA